MSSNMQNLCGADELSCLIKMVPPVGYDDIFPMHEGHAFRNFAKTNGCQSRITS